ncbi:YcjF family protein [Marinimicrobium sp. ABcell2]|uniref:YcjF family protein n=1 Tax=Marinimicrobium sp. ABcell2 TaxID=3069751 RepID=UPI0027B02400|nr:DUF697 domain-containing protein [Marinimicrobium sp. ABcell2]MDQ2078244.1 DUF697 domain-containing protein [Marinimicrobium sp. ABcell2]
MWRKVRKKWFESPVDDAALAEAVAEAQRRQPPPVLWLLGKTQAGKTATINALTGSSKAEIGNGFAPCTRRSQFYDFPPEAPLVRFLDTRGLGELSYDPSEDIQYCESQAHLVMAVIKAADPNQDAVFDVLREVRRRHPDWPLVVVQTGLHELYAAGSEHPQPYPFGTEAEQILPRALMGPLTQQRQRLGELRGRGRVLWVPVDFTLAEDGFEPQFYGLDELWEAIDTASGWALEACLRADPHIRDQYARAAHPYILGYSATAAGLGAIPLADMALVPALQLKLLHRLARLYRLEWTRRNSSEFFGLLGVGVLAGYGIHWAGRGLVKLIPVWGQSVGAVWSASGSAAITYALGKTACEYLARKGQGLTLDRASLRSVYKRELSSAGALPMAKPSEKESQ